MPKVTKHIQTTSSFFIFLRPLENQKYYSLYISGDQERKAQDWKYLQI